MASLSLTILAQDAAKLRKEQQEAKRKAAQESKERRQRRNRKHEPTSPAVGGDSDDDGEGEVAEADMDLLPEDVIEAMVIREQEDKRFLERRIISEQLRVKRQRKQRRTFSEVQAGPVTVKVLKPGSNKKASGKLRQS